MNRVTSTILIFMAAWFLSGCASTGTGKRQSADFTGQLETFRFAVYGMSCDTCAGKASGKLRELRGVVRAGVDYDSKKATVDAKKGAVTMGDIRSALGTLGFEALSAGEQPILPLSDAEKRTLDIQALRQGGRFDLRKNLAQGKVTLFDYYADWCGPCHLSYAETRTIGFQSTRMLPFARWTSVLGNRTQPTKPRPSLNFRDFPSLGFSTAKANSLGKCMETKSNKLRPSLWPILSSRSGSRNAFSSLMV